MANRNTGVIEGFRVQQVTIPANGSVTITLSPTRVMVIADASTFNGASPANLFARFGPTGEEIPVLGLVTNANNWTMRSPEPFERVTFRSGAGAPATITIVTSPNLAFGVGQ